MKNVHPSQRAADRQRRRRTTTAILVSVVFVLAAAAPAAAKPPKHADSGRRQPTTSTSTSTSTPTSTTTTTTTAPPAARAATAAPAPALRRAALRVVVSTTSDWVQVQLPGTSAGHVVVSDTGGRSVQATNGGFIVRGVAKVLGSATVDVVTELPTGATSAPVSVSQGGAGATTVTVDNRTAQPFRATEVRTNWSTPQQAVTLTADALMGPVQLEWARATEDRKVLAFTYPWFGGDWAKTDPRLSVHPLDTWRPGSAADALAMAQQARANGIDGFVMSFAGGAKHGLPLYNALDAAAKTGGTATVLIETVEAGSPAVAEQWIREALAQASSPAFLRLDGVPVVFTFASGKVTAADWQGISDRLAAAGTPVRLIGDTSWRGDDGAMAGQYRYNALFETEIDPMTAPELTAWNQAVSRGLRAKATLGSGQPGVVVATVQPGWDDRLLRGLDRLSIPWDQTATYDETWEAAMAGEADWVMITSWNEWFEGTGVAPSVEHGYDALVATRTWAQRFGG